MRKFARHLIHAAGTITIAGSLALAGAALPANAAAGTASATDTATASATSPSASASADATAAAGATGTAGASATGTPAASSETSVSSLGTGLVSDPSLADQDAAGNHAMGSTVAANEPTAAAGATTMAPMSTDLTPQVTPSGTKGVDISAYQTNVNWASLWNSGVRFAYMKATEGTTYASSAFAGQYTSSYNVGMIRGAYHFATPNTSSGATQAAYFVNHGGGWSNDGRTLPPLLDIEYGYNGTCWGLSTGAMVSWIADFSNTVKSMTGVYPAIYSTTNWWKTCTANSAAFSSNPLFVAVYPVHDFSGPGALGASWSTWAMWQWTSSGAFSGDANRYDLDVMNASYGTLAALASPIAKVSSAPTRREWGTNAYGTAATISSQTYSPGVDTVYVATRANYADALSGAPAAGAESGPTLLVAQTGIPGATATELTRLKPKRVVILGGTAVIQNTVATQLAAYTGNVVRIAGTNRFDTSAQISRATFSPGVSTAYIATGTNFPDALAGAAIAAQSGVGKGLGKASNGGPMLLTMPTEIPSQVAAELARLKPGRIVVLGGTSAISSAVQTQLAAYTTGGVSRWAGTNRFGTAAAVATANFSTAPTVFLATGTDFADALAGAPMAGWNAYPVLLVTKDSIPAETAAALKKLNPSKIVILGGPSAVSVAVQAAL